jgi:O-antigen ligase
MSVAQVAVPVDVGVRAARYLLIASLIAMQFSSSLTVGLEFAVYAVFAWFPALRERLWYVMQQRAAQALAVFLLIVVIATCYGVAPLHDRLGQLSGWRKALLFFFAAAAFDDEDSKRELAGIYFAVCLVALLLSAVTYAANLRIYKDIGRGLIIHNYATQSFAFSLAIGIAVLALVDRARFAADPLLRHWWLAVLAIVAFVAAIAFMLPGRSGYMILIIMAVTLAVTLGGGTRRIRLAAGACVVVGVTGVLSSSPLVRHRVELAISEMENAERSQNLTSGGVRVVMWNTAWQIISEHPVLGVGTAGFKTAYAQKVEGRAGWQAEPTGDPHNQYLKIWAEQGIFGLAAILVFIGLALTTRGITPFRELGLAILLASSASSLVNSHFSTFFEGRMVFFWLGAMLSTPAPSQALRKSPSQIIYEGEGDQERN